MGTEEALYLDSKHPLEARVGDVLSRPTLDEKLAQIGCVRLSSLLDERGTFSESRARSR